MKTIRFGESLTLPSNAVTQTFAFLARRGAGKTYAAGVLVEGMFNLGAQVVILDPVGVWYGLRLAHDGKAPGLPIPVFGGEHGDIPLEPGAGALIADLVVDRGISVVLDVSGFRKNQRKEFVTAFAEQLFHRKKTSRSAVHVVFEEAQLFVPQKTFKGEERMLGAMEDLIKLGRNYGIGVSLISQRPQAVNKDVLNQTECLVVLQTTGPQERKVIEGWIDEHGIEGFEKAMDNLPKMGIGTAYVWSPQWLGTFKHITVSKKRTYDASSTPTVGVATKQRKLAPVDLVKIREAMKDVVARAEENDPKALKRRIFELESKAADIPKPDYLVLDAKQTREVEKAIEKTERLIERVDRMTKEGYDQIAISISALTKTIEDTKNVVRLAGPFHAPRPARVGDLVLSVPERQSKTSARTPMVPDLKTSCPPLGRGARAILTVLARYPEGKSRKQLGPLTGYRSDAGHFGNILGVELKPPGYIEGSAERFQITQTGLTALGRFEPLPPPGQQLIEWWTSKLPAPEGKLLVAIADVYPNSMTRSELGETTGYRSDAGHFGNLIGALRGKGLVEGSASALRASPDLFE